MTVVSIKHHIYIDAVYRTEYLHPTLERTEYLGPHYWRVLAAGQAHVMIHRMYPGDFTDLSSWTADQNQELVIPRADFVQQATLLNIFEKPYILGRRRSGGVMMDLTFHPRTQRHFVRLEDGSWEIDLRLVPESAYTFGYHPGDDPYGE